MAWKVAMARMRTSRAGRSNSGFTLIELMVALLLLGLAATLVATRIGAGTAAARLRAAHVTLERALRLARHEARVKHAPRWLVFEVGAGRYAVTRNAEPLVWRSLGAVEVISVRIGSDPPAAPQIRVGATGASPPWAIELRAGGQTLALWNDGVTDTLRTGAGRLDRIGVGP